MNGIVEPTVNGNPAEDHIDPAEDDIISGRSGKVTGLIYPPPDIRAVVDKTAQWVAKNGKSFEDRILNSEEGKSAKFNFMKPTDPYNSYYEYKIRMFEEGIEPPEKKQKTSVDSAAASIDTPKKDVSKPVAATVAKATVLGPIARAKLNKPKEPLPPHEFYVIHPQGLSAFDIEVIKLTAQYTAASGRQFLAALAQKEQRNPIFEFLKPTHVLFSYFTTLVDAYIKILQPTDKQKAYVKDGVDKQKVLEAAVHRWQAEKDEEQSKKSAQAEQEAERVAYQSVDWHDFVVVETITFAEDELMDVGMPGMAAEGEEEVEQQQPQQQRRPAAPPATRRHESEPEEDMDMDMDLDEQLPFRAVQPPPPRALQQNPPPPPPRPSVDVDADEPEIKVVSGYVPRIGEQRAQPQMMLDPVTGKEVPIEQVGEHMRIQFLDPRWREEQKRMLDRKRESALAGGDDIAANVRNFAKKRTDIFGTAEDEEREILEESERFRSRQQEGNRIIWDGSIASAPAIRQTALSQPVGPAAALPGSNVGPMYLGGTNTLTGAAFNLPAPPPPPPGPPPQPTYHPPQPPQSSFTPPPPPPGPRPAYPSAPPPHTPADDDVDMEADEAPEAAFASATTPGGLLPEAAFASGHPGPALLSIQTPVDDSNPTSVLKGQVLPIRLPSVLSSIRQVKDMLSQQLGGLPANKMELRAPNQGFLKDAQTLASYNVGSNRLIELVLRSRGGRR